MIAAGHPFQQRSLNALDENGNEGCASCGRPRDAHTAPASAAAPGPERDLSNAQLAGANGLGQVTILMPKAVMTRDEALVHAAWLVILAGGELEISGIIAAIGGAS